VIATGKSDIGLVNVIGTFNTSSSLPLIVVNNTAKVSVSSFNVNSTGVSGSYLAKISNNAQLYLYNNTFTDFNTGIYAEINSTVDARTANTFTNVSNQFKSFHSVYLRK